jgi:lysophospholipase L1-like esterase
MSPSRTRRSLFVAWTVAAVLLLAGVGLIVWNFSLLRHRADLRALLRFHRVDFTLGMLLDEQGKTDAEREHIRNCYLHPDAIDLNRISWNVIQRPTPFVGYAPHPGLQREGPFNSHQFRDEREVTLPKPAGVFRIFLTGGSLAYSVAAPDHTQSIARLLQDRLNAAAESGLRYEVWNAADTSWSSANERIWITHRLQPLDPDLVIMLTGVNDCHWAFGGYDIFDLRNYAEEEFFALINLGRRIGGVDPYPAAPPDHRNEPLPVGTVAERFAANVRLSAAALAPDRVPLLVALQPYLSPRNKRLVPVERQWTEDPANAPKLAYMDHCFDAMQTAVGDLAAPTTPTPFVPPGSIHPADLRSTFAEREAPIFIDLFHVADKGNALLAERLEQALREKKLLPSP